MYFLAELNDDNVCVNIKSTKELIENDKHILIESLNEDFLWRKYENGNWSEEKFIPEYVPQITLEDKINYIYYKQMGVI